MNDPFDLDEPAYPSPPPPPAYATAHVLGDLQHAGFRCPSCTYDLTGAVIGGQCPECGAHIDSQSIASTVTNGMAVTSMILGILALALCIFYGIFTIILAPMGIIFGHVARKQIRTGRYTPGSAGFALTGLICSYTAIGLVLATILAIVIAFTL